MTWNKRKGFHSLRTLIISNKPWKLGNYRVLRIDEIVYHEMYISRTSLIVVNTMDLFRQRNNRSINQPLSLCSDLIGLDYMYIPGDIKPLEIRQHKAVRHPIQILIARGETHLAVHSNYDESRFAQFRGI